MAIPPIYIPQGTALVYGDGVFQTENGITPPGNTLWGTIYNVNTTTCQLGDRVLFYSDKVVCRLAYSGVTGTGNYTMIGQEAILATQIIDIT